jgi:hypothetical protein
VARVDRGAAELSPATRGRIPARDLWVTNDVEDAPHDAPDDRPALGRRRLPRADALLVSHDGARALAVLAARLRGTHGVRADDRPARRRRASAPRLRPAKDKISPPRYQGIRSDEIPTVALPDGAGTVRVVAGAFAGVAGPAKTFTPIHVWDLRLVRGRRTEPVVPDGWTTALVGLRGTLRLDGGQALASAEVAVFERAGERIAIDVDEDATALLLSGEPIDEPIVGEGPFVMNDPREIRQAMIDYQNGRMGGLA